MEAILISCPTADRKSRKGDIKFSPKNRVCFWKNNSFSLLTSFSNATFLCGFSWPQTLNSASSFQAVNGLFTTLERHPRDPVESSVLHLPSMSCSLVPAKVTMILPAKLGHFRWELGMILAGVECALCSSTLRKNHNKDLILKVVPGVGSKCALLNTQNEIMCMILEKAESVLFWCCLTEATFKTPSLFL